jgi:hypothetical protein
MKVNLKAQNETGMASQSDPVQSGLQTKLDQIAQLLRQTDHLDPQTQQNLARLVQELGQALAAAPISPEEKASLAESTSHLVHALHQKHEKGVLAKARQRLSEAVASVETQAPLAAQLAARLLDALASSGI